jgi:branched-chain amino acid transport system ATP-binding protein
MAAALELDRVSAGYRGVPVIRDVSLTVEPGEVVALLGPNGAGKTTTLRASSGLLAPFAGAVRTLGRTATGVPAHRLSRLGVAHVPEGRALFPTLTVRETLRLGARRRASPDDATEWFPALAPLMGRAAGLLSGGEQQMLAVARALLGQPRVLMVDEPSLGLAPKVVSSLLDMLRRVADERAVGVLIVEQHTSLVLAVAHRAYVMNRGRVVVSGPAPELAERGDVLQSSYLG